MPTDRLHHLHETLADEGGITMSLRDARLHANLKGHHVSKYLQLTVDRRIDSGLYSKMENNLCRPTPKQFKVICEFLGVDPSEIYSREDVDYGISSQKPSEAVQTMKKQTEYKLTVRLPLVLAKNLNVKLSRNGYPSITAFVCDSIRNLK